MKKKAFVQYTKKGKIVPGSLVLTEGSYPQGPAIWKEVPVWFNDAIDCSTADYSDWQVVTDDIAGDGSASNVQNFFTVIGPNDSNSDGWVYLKKYFPLGANLIIPYTWTSSDSSPDQDYVVYWTSSIEPTGIPDDLTPKIPIGPFQTNTWSVTVAPGEWFAIGVYSIDSTGGAGTLTFTLLNN